jgi:hypothetical protein
MRAAFAAIAIAFCGQQACADEVSIRDLSGARIDANWFRYINTRFGLAVDIPTRGYKYEVPVNSSGLTLSSPREEIVITLYAHWVVNVFEAANNDVQRTIAHLFDNAIAETLHKNGTVDYSARKEEFYVMSGHFGNSIYYERLIVSSRWPAIFNSLRIFYLKNMQKDLDLVVTRMSNTLTATCKGEEGPAFIN